MRVVWQRSTQERNKQKLHPLGWSFYFTISAHTALQNEQRAERRQRCQSVHGHNTSAPDAIVRQKQEAALPQYLLTIHYYFLPKIPHTSQLVKSEE